jgi:hypothetical protein
MAASFLDNRHVLVCGAIGAQNKVGVVILNNGHRN